MEIYYQIESKENREDKNAQKIRRKILRIGRLSDVEGKPTAPQSRGDSLPEWETRPDLDEVGVGGALHGAPCCVASYNST